MPIPFTSEEYSQIYQQFCGYTDYKYIHEYNYNPKEFIFHKLNDENELYLGIELEIDKGGKNDENAKMVEEFLGKDYVYCKHDGSLSNGFEIVTHPCTYEYHLILPYEDLFKKLINLKYKSHDTTTCGLHIHFNRDYFGKEKLCQDLKISELLYLFEKFWSNITLIARRGSNNYASRCGLEQDETILDMYAKSKSRGKYCVINLQHKNTVELRIFKGTLNYQTFIATLQFVNTIVNFVKDIDIYDIQNVTWDDIQSNFDEELKTYIEERKQNKNIKETNNSNGNNDFNLNSFNRYFIQSNSNGYQTVNSDCNLGEIHMGYFAEFRNSQGIIHANRSEPQQLTEAQILQNQIRDMQREINRSRNPMEQRQLRREMQDLNVQLGQLRRRH